MTDSQPQTGPFLAFQNPVSTFDRPHTPKENPIGAQSTGLVFSVLPILWVAGLRIRTANLSLCLQRKPALMFTHVQLCTLQDD
jgi:hypothetical protein